MVELFGETLHFPVRCDQEAVDGAVVENSFALRECLNGA